MMRIPEVSCVTHRFVDVDGVRFHVAEAGGVNADTVLLLHGFPQHWYAWRHVLSGLSDRRHLVAIDFRGFGWSDAPGRGYSMTARTHDVLSVMDAMGIERADVIGHDWGALTGLYLARDHPDRIRRAVAISMVHLWPQQRHLAPTAWRWWVTALFEWPGLGPWILRRHQRITTWLMTRDAVRPQVWTSQLLSVYADVAREPARAEAAQRLHLGIVRELPRLLFGRARRLGYDVPTLVLGGCDDTLIPPRVLSIPSDRCDTVTVRTVPGGHFLLDESPDHLLEEIRDHLALPEVVDQSTSE